MWDGTHAPCNGSTKSEALDQQRNPLIFLKGIKTKLFSYMIESPWLEMNHFNLKWITSHKKLNVSLPESNEKHEFIHWNVCQQYSLKVCLWMTFFPLLENNRSSMSLAGLYKLKAFSTMIWYVYIFWNDNSSNSWLISQPAPHIVTHFFPCQKNF